ncbi:PH domain-containing protein [Rhinopithecimicrobium faecis]
MDQFIKDGQDPKVVEKLFTKVRDMLTTGEYIQYIALQKKPAVTILPDSITVSNKRIFLCEFTKLGLATDFEIFSWESIKDIAFKEEIFGSKVTVIPNTGENLSIDYIPKTQARKLYQLIKDSLEQAKNGPSPTLEPTDTFIEEAIYEPVLSDDSKLEIPQEEQVENAPETIFQEQPQNSLPEEEDELTLRLQKLKRLYDKQLITQAEYETKKSELLSQI